MSMVKLVCGLLIIAAALVQQGSTLKCFICSSDQDENCGEPFNKKSLQLVHCETELSKVKKPGQGKLACGKQGERIGDTWTYLRFCSWMGPDKVGLINDDCVVREYANNNTAIKVCYCDDRDGCNDSFGSDHLNGSTAVVASLVLVSLIAATLGFNYS